MTRQIRMRCTAYQRKNGQWVLYVEGLKFILEHAEEGVFVEGSGGIIGSDVGNVSLLLKGRHKAK